MLTSTLNPTWVQTAHPPLIFVDSCGGGSGSYHITNQKGATSALWGTFVAYHPDAKVWLGVPKWIFDFGIYSPQMAATMAIAGLFKVGRRPIRIAASMTGSLSHVDPRCGHSKPGEVYLAVVIRNGRAYRIITKKFAFKDNGKRGRGKKKATIKLFQLVLAAVKDESLGQVVVGNRLFFRKKSVLQRAIAKVGK